MTAAPSSVEVGPGIWQVENRVFPSNTYLCATGPDGGCLLVDPGLDPEGIDAALTGLGLRPTHVLCTHGHFDHVGGTTYFQKKYEVPCHLHDADRAELGRANFLMMALRVHFVMELPRVTGMDDLPAIIGEKRLTVFHAPGHTPGSCMILYGGGLFSGDTLFSRGVGLSKLPGGDREELKASLLRLWDRIPDEALVCPGHGGCAPFSGVRIENGPLRRFLGMADLERTQRRGETGTA